MPPVERDPDPTAPPRVLVVDDDADTRRLLSLALTTSGFDVVEAASGDEALRLLGKHPFSAVLLDRTMPGVDGNEVLRWIRRTPSTAMLPVMLVTGRDDVADVVHGLESGADDYVIKPFDPLEVLARLRSHLRGRAVWADLVRQEVERRASLMDAAQAVTSSGPPDQGAMQLCDGLVRLDGVGGAAFVEVVGDTVVPLASKGVDAMELLARDQHDRPLGRHLASRARQGAWLQNTVSRLTSETTPIAIAPVAVDEMVVGLVLAVPAADAGRSVLDGLLAIAIDFAALAGGVLGPSLLDTARRDAARKRFTDMVDHHQFATVFQPVLDLIDDEVVGFEALTRFELDSPTQRIFADAARVGAGLDVELRTLEAAITGARALPPTAWLSVNVSPTLVVSGDDLAEHLSAADARQVVIELSELEPVSDYGALRTAIDKLGAEIQLSVDDAGSGFSSLAHILALGPEYVKIDRSWIHGIDHDPAKRALVAGIQNFAAETHATVIAEGIETEGELETVRSLGIRQGQGFLLGPPSPA